MAASTDDPMYKVRDFLDTHISLTKDNNSTAATHLCFISEGSVETLKELFTAYDVLLTIKPWNDEYYRWVQAAPFLVKYSVAVVVTTTDKSGITGVLMLGKTRHQLETLIEANKQPAANIEVRIIGRSSTKKQHIGGITIWEAVFIVEYKTT